MSERGVFAVDRGIWDHDFLAEDDRPFSRREAWVWLVSEAAWRDRAVRVGGVGVKLSRGQIAHSIRFIAKAWHWPKSNVARFLDGLEHESMIGTETVHGQTIITIRKYDEYQRVSLPDRDNSGTASGTEVGQQRDKLEDIKTIEIEVIVTERDRVIATWPADWFDQFWQAYPLKVGRKKAQAALAGVRSRGEVEFPRLMAAVEAYAATADPNYTAHATTWINRGGWDDEIKPRRPDGNRADNHRANTPAGPAAAREASFLAGLGAGALRQLEARASARPAGPLSPDADATGGTPAYKRTA